MTTIVSGTTITTTIETGQGVAGVSIPAGGASGAPLRKNSSADYDASYGAVDKSWVGLSNADNTSDLNKPVSSATQAAINSAASPVYPVNVTATVYGETLTFENATTLTVGKSRSYRNDSDYDVKIKNFVGTALGFIPARSVVVATCENTSTTAGIWHLVGARKMGTVTNRSAAISFGAFGNLEVITIDSDRQLLIGSGTSTYAVVYDRTTNTWGNELFVRAGTTNRVRAIKVGTDNVMIVSCSATTGMEAVVLTVSGVSLSLNTVGTATLAGNWSEWGSLIQLTSTLYVIGYQRATTITATRAISLSGTTPSIGAEDTVSGTGAAPHLYANTTSTYTVVSATTSLLYAKTNSVSGNTITAGTEVSTACTSPLFRTMLMSTGNIAIMYLNTTTRGGFVSVSGTVPSISTAALSASTAPVQSQADWVAISSTKIATASSVASAGAYFNILVETAGAASAGAAVSLLSSQTDGVCALLSASGNTARFFVRQNSRLMFVATVDASGTNPNVTYQVTGQEFEAPFSAPTYSSADGGVINASVMPSGGGFVVPSTNNRSGSWFITDRFTKISDTVNLLSTITKRGHSRSEAWTSSISSGQWFLSKVEVAE